MIFDVFGTCVDWRRSIAQTVTEVLPEVDAFAFADAWRGEYDPAMARIRAGNRGYVALDVLHLENLLRVAEQFGVTLEDAESLNSAWERLMPWPDVLPGLEKMAETALIAPCSNGSIALMARMARHVGLPWHAILGAELAQNYKPHPSVYLASCAALQLDPSEVVMVAAHNGDLHAARGAGLATAFVPRPVEHGPKQTTDLHAEGDWDYLAPDFVALAEML